MARRSRIKTLAELAGKLGGIRRQALGMRRQALNVLRGIKREIAKRAKDLAGLKAEYAKAKELLRGRATSRPARVRRRARRARQVNWKEVFGSLPGRFTMKTLVRHPVAGRRPKGHLYAILSRWKKEGVLAKDPAGGYRKASAQSKKKRGARRAKPAARKPAPAARRARVQKPSAQPGPQSA